MGSARAEPARMNEGGAAGTRRPRLSGRWLSLTPRRIGLVAVSGDDQVEIAAAVRRPMRIRVITPSSALAEWTA